MLYRLEPRETFPINRANVGVFGYCGRSGSLWPPIKASPHTKPRAHS
jgi:hypothetical protein